ncbi:MAG: hypothetical protein BWZ10_03439 [candidate division BRC1 bacterium ADurb.BinA364]|nr:MAG: hypothetical protein BWZ10_03439 [candidate division BRC1 bacterium ADurb.BinA364]
MAAARPLDPRARGLLAARQSPEGASASKALQAVEALGLARRLEGRDFLSAGHPFANDTLTTHGMAAARLAQSAQALWLVAQGSPSLGVYPLTFLELDGELSIRYLHGVAAFPEYARRRDGRPFAEVRIWLLNPFADPRLLTRRQLALHGAFDASGYRGWDAP